MPEMTLQEIQHRILDMREMLDQVEEAVIVPRPRPRAALFSLLALNSTAAALVHALTLQQVGGEAQKRLEEIKRRREEGCPAEEGPERESP